MERLIAELGLTPHPEGGFFRETWRASATLPGSTRSVGTAIYYLLAHADRSRLHRIDADEVWHFYQGAPLDVVELMPGQAARVTTLSAARPQHTVRAGTWFGARLSHGSKPGDFALVGCTVSPAFEFAHFELGTPALAQAFPLAHELITALT